MRRVKAVPHHPGAATPTCVCPHIRHTPDTRCSTLAERHNAGLRMPQHAQTRKTRTGAATFRLHLIRCAYHGIRRATDGRRPAPLGNRNTDLRMPRHTGCDRNRNQVIQTPPPRHLTRIFADNARGGSPHRILHVQCKASASLVDRRLPVLAYRFRRSRPYRPALALT